MDGSVLPVQALDPRRDIGARVRTARVARGISLRRLAGELGVSPATLSAVETGATGLSAVRLVQVADLLDVPVEQLVSRAARPSSAGPDPHGEGWRHYAPLQLDPALRGALSAFSELGYAGSSVRDIAERAGLSVPGLYHHHASKQDLLVALLELAMDDLLARSAAALADGAGPVERFCLLVECLALFHAHRRGLAFLGASEMRSLDPAPRARVVAARTRQQRLVDTEVESAVRAGAFATPVPREASRAVVTLCTALPQWYSPNGPATPEHVAAQHVGFALALVQCTTAPPRGSA